MKLININTIENKKSKFIAYYYEITSYEDVLLIITELKKEHKKARHIVYAYRLNEEIKKFDDGEPKNTAGMPILNVIEKNNLNKNLIVVVRYFGGILLGAGPLTRTYSKSAANVIKI